MKTNEVSIVAEIVKESYVKPTMEVYEMELEGGVLLGASGDDFGGDVDNGVGRPINSGLPWEKYSTKHGL